MEWWASPELDGAVGLMDGADIAGRLAEEDGRVTAKPAVAVVGSSGMLARDSGRRGADDVAVPGGKESGQLTLEAARQEALEGLQGSSVRVALSDAWVHVQVAVSLRAALHDLWVPRGTISWQWGD